MLYTSAILPDSKNNDAPRPAKSRGNEDTMQDAANSFDQPLADLTKQDWLLKLEQIVQEHGTFTPLGKRHLAAYIEGEEDTTTLLVSFENIEGIRVLSDTAQPLGWDMNKAMGWAHLCLASDGDTWFRDPHVFEHIDALTDDGFFDAFDNIIFYGAGPCGYAAAAFSVAAPGSTVVMIQPQATLDPRVAEWDDRFTDMRRTDFTARYGYAPEMLDAAKDAYVLFDPAEHLDAMHAALYTKSHVTMLRLRHMGNAIQSDLIALQMLYRVLAKAGNGKLDAQSFAAIYRGRRNYPPYLRRILAALDRQKRPELAYMLARNVTSRMNAPRFQRRLNELAATLGKDAASS